MTKQELGQKIKEKYSQYQGIDDEILADKIIAKYPSYASQITDTPSIKSSVKGMLEQKTSGIRNAISGSATALKERGQEIKEAFVKSKEGDISPVQGAGRIVGSTIGGAGDILFNVIKEGVRAISPETVEVAKKGISKIGETKVAQDISTAYSNWASKNPEAAKDLSAIANIASVLPAERAVALGGKALVKGGTKVIEKGLETGLKTTGKGLKILGTSGEKAGKTLVSAALPPKEMAGRVLSYKAKTPLVSRFKQAMEGVEKAPVTPADVVIKYNLPTVSRSGIGIKAKRVANKLFENQVKPTLKGIKERISKNEVFDGIQKTINKEVDISRRKALQTAFNALSEDYSKVSNWSAKTLDEIKSGLTKRLPSKVWQGQDIAGDMNNVRKIFSDEARKAVRSRLPENVITIYDDYGALRDVEKMGTKALQSGLNQGMIGLTGEALRITTVPTATALGTGVSKVGTLLRKAGTKLQSKNVKLKNIKPGLTIEDVSKAPLPKGKGEILRTTPKLDPKNFKTAEDYVKARTKPHYINIEDIKSSLDADTYSSLRDTPRNQNINLLNEYKSKISKIEKSPVGREITKPISIQFNVDGGDGYRILDGNHRYLQALKNGDKKILVKFETPKVTSQESKNIFKEKTKSKLISEWNKAQKLKSTPLKSLDDSLIQEAKKYKSADEFIKANLNKADYRSAHQLSLSDSITADKIDIPTLKEAIRTRNGYLNNYNLTDLKKLEKLKNNPDADVVIYRASPKNELNDGDWVTTDKIYANDIKRQNGGNVYSYTAKVKDLRFPKDVETLPSLSMASTFSYSPKTSQLIDIWNKAQKLK